MNRRIFLQASGLALGASALPAIAQSATRRKTVLLQCGWATKNIGDIGHTPGTLRFLEQYLPQANVILWAANTNAQVDAMLMRRFPKLEIVKGSLSEKDGGVQRAIQRSDFFLRGPGMGQSTDFMIHCRKIGKPWGLQAQSYFPDMITGKGASFGSDGALKRAVPAWLATPTFRPLVSGHDHAARKHGGGGAIYVRLRKKG